MGLGRVSARELAKPCILQLICPGDAGTTEVMYRGRVQRVSKASNVVKLYGSLEAAAVYVNKAYVLAVSRGLRRVARALRLAMSMLMMLGFHVATGDERYEVMLYKLACRLNKLIYSMSRPSPTGWVVCRDELCSAINEARVWVRWAERRVVANNDLDVAKWLNIVGNQLFELMRLMNHEVYRGVCRIGAVEGLGEMYISEEPIIGHAFEG